MRSMTDPLRPVCLFCEGALVGSQALPLPLAAGFELRPARAMNKLHHQQMPKIEVGAWSMKQVNTSPLPLTLRVCGQLACVGCSAVGHDREGRGCYAVF